MGDEYLGFYFLGATTLAVAIGVPFGASHYANSLTQKTIEAYNMFEKQKIRLKHLRYAQGSESWRWPIYVRPVLFTDIDRFAQYHFANAEHALWDAENIQREIAPLPEIPTSRIKKIITSPTRISTCLQIQQDVFQFIDLLDQAQGEIDLLCKEHTKEIELHQSVKDAVQNLEEKVGGGLLNPKAIAQGIEYENRLNWASNAVQNCLYLSKEKIEKPVDDGMNYAIAYILTKLGGYVLKDLDLYERHFQIPSRFDLDHFNNRLTKLGNTLSRIIGIASVQNWHELYLTDRMLELANVKLQQVNNSLNDFLEKQNIFSNLENNLNQTDFVKMVKDADALQGECAKYWRTREEDYDMWAVAIGSNPLPSQQIENARRYAQAQVMPVISAGTIIKQTCLGQIILDISSVLTDINNAREDIASLAEQLIIHKKSEKDVWERINPQGDLFQAVKRLAPIESDSSVDIIQKCRTCRQTFETYLDKAKAVRGANFPVLLTKLDGLLDACESAELEHKRVISQLVFQAKKVVQKMSELRDEIAQLQGQKPQIEWDWNNAKNKLTRVIDQYNPQSKSYLALSTYLSQAKTALDNGLKDNQEIQALRLRFVSQYNSTGKRLDELRQELIRLDQDQENAWSWARGTFAKSLQPAHINYQTFYQNWTQAMHLDTAKQALAICKNIEDDVSRSLDKLTQDLKDVREKQKEYSEWHDYLLDRAQPTGFWQIREDNYNLIQRLCNLARQTDKQRDIKLLFDTAEDVLKRDLSKDEKIHIEKFVQDFSQRIDQLNNYGVANFSPNISQEYRESQ